MLQLTTCQFNLLAHILMVICHVRTLFCVTVRAASITSTTNVNKYRIYSLSFASVTIVPFCLFRDCGSLFEAKLHI